jgi:hypothetical protein
MLALHLLVQTGLLLTVLPRQLLAWALAVGALLVRGCRALAAALVLRWCLPPVQPPQLQPGWRAAARLPAGGCLLPHRLV